ncbi:glutathione-regulated potassium-efflux system kefB domain protein, partial [Yersinia pestis PY-102]
MAKKINIV